ncbi:shugoshin-1-like isoform X4 [Dioscorea cayenensis subsp. rotundata]|uniref:Shugoshin-1-like isoform X4 n=1 Tax=Dioscorea cayennensis subsp. rotundata TaxID=55577 RepID=A0AB40CEP3_DIOCR|nr:shugoshin-1-like isoform X4 [Dioscorea cayenensis subsp. rotundata]
MENHAVGAIKTLPFCVGRAERSQKMPVIGSAMGRKMLSDITNTARAVEVAGDGESDAVDNPALLKLLYEKSKIIEMSGMELLNLRTALQKAHQQNWQLAQANSRMLGELNQGKDRLKVMQHELSCALALVRAKTLEVEEQKKVAKHVPEKTITELKKEGDANVEVVAERNNPASSKNVCGTNRKRALRTKSLGSSNAAHEVTSVKEKDEKRRRSLRRKSQVCEPTEDLFEIEDAKFLICSSSEPLHETGSSPVEISVKEFENEQNDSPQNQNQNSRRSLSGRPVRKATEKVCSYKERPINVKMRRGE